MGLIEILPTCNAFFNGCAFFFLIRGYRAILKKDIQKHRKMMLMAFCASALFLVSYLTYHYTADGMRLYDGDGFWKIFYYIVLFTHIPLAGVIPIFALLAIISGLKNKVEYHKKIAKKLIYPWFYVSLTGIIIYVMLL